MSGSSDDERESSLDGSSHSASALAGNWTERKLTLLDTIVDELEKVKINYDEDDEASAMTPLELDVVIANGSPLPIVKTMPRNKEQDATNVTGEDKVERLRRWLSERNKLLVKQFEQLEGLNESYDFLSKHNQLLCEEAVAYCRLRCIDHFLTEGDDFFYAAACQTALLTAIVDFAREVDCHPVDCLLPLINRWHLDGKSQACSIQLSDLYVSLCTCAQMYMTTKSCTAMLDSGGDKQHLVGLLQTLEGDSSVNSNRENEVALWKRTKFYLNEDGFPIACATNSSPRNECSIDEDKVTRLKLFETKENRSLIRAFRLLETLEESYEFLLTHGHLLCEEAMEYLVLWCIEVEVSGRKRLWDSAARQAALLHLIVSTARQSDQEPFDCLLPVILRLKLEDATFMELFNDNLGKLKTRVRECSQARLENPELPPERAVAELIQQKDREVKMLREE